MTEKTVKESAVKKFFLLVAAALLLVAPGLSTRSSAIADTVLSPDSIPIAYSVTGASAPALVFVHCWCCDRGYWKEQVGYFASRNKVVTLDLAGHGESGAGRKAWTVAAYGGDVAAVAEGLDLERVVLIGHSMGARVILEAARRMPERVIGLVGVDSYQNFELSLQEERVAQFMAAFDAGFEDMTRKFVRALFTADADTTLIALIADDMSSAPAEVGVGSLRNTILYSPLEALKEIKAPIRAINSDRVPTNVGANKRHAPSFDVKLMPGRGHFLHMEDPGIFNKVLELTIEEFTGGRRK